MQLTLVVFFLYQPGISKVHIYIQMSTFCNLHNVVVVVCICGGYVWCGVMCGIRLGGVQHYVLHGGVNGEGQCCMRWHW